MAPLWKCVKERGRRAAAARVHRSLPAGAGAERGPKTKGGRGRARRSEEPRRKLGEEPPRPGEQVLDRAVNGDGQQRERCQDRDRVTVDRPDEAVDPVPAEALAPVDVRLEHRERERGHEEERCRTGGQHAGPEPGRRHEPPALELKPDAHGAHGKRKHRRGENGSSRQDSQERHGQVRPERAVVGELGKEHGLRREGVDERPRREDDGNRDERPDPEPQPHRTWSTKGAVSTLPSTFPWRNNRHLPGSGDEHADLQLPGRRRGARDLGRPEHAGAAAHPGRADVGVEVVEASLAEEDRVRERPEPRGERRRLPVGAGDVDSDELRLDRLQRVRPVKREVIAVDRLRRTRLAERARMVRAGDRQVLEELEVRVDLLVARGRVHVDDEPVGPRCGEGDELVDRRASDRGMLVHDVLQVSPHEDQVHAGVGARALLELRERRPVGLLDLERDEHRLAGGDRLGRLEVRDLVGRRRLHGDRLAAARAAAAGEPDNGHEGREGDRPSHSEGDRPFHESPPAKRKKGCGGT